MTKKRWGLIFVVLIIALSLVLVPMLSGCGAADGDEDDDDGVAEPQEFVIKYHSVYGPNTYGAVAMQEVFGPRLEAIAADLGYDLKMEYYWNAALFSADAHTQALSDGAIGMGSVGTYKMNSYDARWNAFDMPLLVYDYYVKAEVLETPVFADLAAKTEELLGLHIFWASGGDYPSGDPGVARKNESTPASYHLFTKEEYPIHTMEDLAGLRVRTMTSPGQVEMGTALGFMSQAITFGEAPMALQTGMLEGLITCPDMGYYVPLGVFDYLKCTVWDTNFMAGYFPNCINNSLWQSFPDDLKAAINAYIPEYLVYLGGQAMGSGEEAGQALIDADFTITYLQDTPGELGRWHDAVAYIWDDFAEQTPGGKEMIDGIKAAWAASPWDPRA